MFLNDVLKEFLFDCQIRKLSVKTTKSYRNNLEPFIYYLEKEFNVLELEQISSVVLKNYFQYLTMKGLKESYINSILKTFRAFFKYCIQEEYIIKNPCEKIPWQKECKTLIKTFSDEEVKKMIEVFDFSDYLNARNKTLIAFLVDTGARNYETCCLLKEDIKEDFIKIHGKGKKERYVGVSPLLRKYMIKFERIRDFYFKDKNIKHNNYFLSRTGLPLTDEAIQRVVREAGEIACVRKEIRCSPHTLRHYFSQSQLKQGLDVYSLSRLLGHESVNITKVYLQSLRDEEIVQMSVRTSPLMNL